MLLDKLRQEEGEELTMLAGLQEVRLCVLTHKNWLRSEMRVSINQKKVDQYAREKAAGHRFPSPVVFVDPEEMYWLGDGFHRVMADQKNGCEAVEVFVKPGTLKDAILWNLKANRESQGLPFAKGDLSKAVSLMLTNSMFSGCSRMEISRMAGCSAGLVSDVARKLGIPKARDTAHGRLGVRTWDVEAAARMRQQGMCYREIGERVGVCAAVVLKALAECFKPCPHCNGTGKVLKEPANGETQKPVAPV